MANHFSQPVAVMPDRSATSLETILSRLQGLSDHVRRLEDTADRAFGQRVAELGKGDAPSPQPPGLLYAADAEIDMLYRRLMEVADRLSVLA